MILAMTRPISAGRQLMWRTRKTSISLSRLSTQRRSFRLNTPGLLDGIPRQSPRARWLTTAICGSATLAMAVVLGFSIAHKPPTGPAAEEGDIVYLVNRGMADTEPDFVDSARSEDR